MKLVLFSDHCINFLPRTI